VKNAQIFSDALASNADGLKDFMAGVADLGRTIRPLATRLEGLAGNVDRLVTAVDPAKVRSIVDNAEEFTAVLGRNRQNIDTLLTDAAKVARDLGQQTAKLDNVLSSAEQIARAIDPKKVANAVDSVDRFASMLDRNGGNTDAIMKNTAELTAKLNASADKIESVMKSVEGFLGGPGSSGMFTEVGEAAKAIRKMAENLDARTKEMTAGINRFTGPGLKQYETLAVDARRTLDEINRAVRSLGKNPQQVLFGAQPPVPEYSGR
jgi:phospholipid/cholesterol/gamma-HCH transport system substrate-binding protein